MRQRTTKGELIEVDSPFKMPDADKRTATQEPFVKLEMLTPQVKKKQRNSNLLVKKNGAAVMGKRSSFELCVTFNQGFSRVGSLVAGRTGSENDPA